MKHRSLVVGLFSILILSASPQILAKSETESTRANENQQAQYSALHYLQKMKHSYTQLNYEMLYLNTAQTKIDPQQFIHGVLDEKRIAYFRYLNGPMRESLQFKGTISYYEQGNRAYSLESTQDRSVFSNVASFDFDSGNENYEYIILGKGRIAGKQAIAIRMISKDEYRYSYLIWLDIESYLPLRLDTINQSNVALEQTMVMSLNVTESINPWLAQLSTQKIPEVLHLSKESTVETMQWEIQWLPKGFHIIQDDQHKLMMHDTDPVSYFMLSDGLVRVSVYISTKEATGSEQVNIIQRGDTLLYTQQQSNIEINIIGEIPQATAEKIATSISMVE